MTHPPIFREPDLSARPHRLTAERQMPLPASTLYKAWPMVLEQLEKRYSA